MARDLLTHLDAVRLENLKTQIQLVRTQSPFYRQKFSAVSADAIKSMSDISTLPFTDNAEIRGDASLALLLDSATPQGYYESSGTTGLPTAGFPDLSPEKARSFGDALDAWMNLRNCRISRALVCLAYELNPTGIRIQTALPHAGVMAIPVGVRSTICPPETVINIVRRLDPQAIFGRPLEILRLGDSLRDVGLDPANTSISKVFMLGEAISRSKWDRIRNMWGDADVYAHYGLTEVDTGLQTCPQLYYHEPQTPYAHFYLIDDEARAIEQSGDIGELVISVLKAAHAPLINYRTGDIARRWTGKCKCGLDTPRYEIFGRKSDRQKFGSTEVFPIVVEECILSCPDVGNEYALVVERDGHLRIVLEHDPSSSLAAGQVAENVSSALLSTISLSAEVQVRPYGTLADKLGIAKKKGGRFIDLRGLTELAAETELRVNVIDSRQLRTGHGTPISI
jgi:phenylacetate-CoA ligase